MAPSTYELREGVWWSLAVVFNQSTAAWYYSEDGEPAQRFPDRTWYGTVSSGRTQLLRDLKLQFLGVHTYYDPPTMGSIGAVVGYNRALTHEEIARNFDALHHRRSLSSDACSRCPAGTSKQTTSDVGCSACAAGTFSAAGASACTACSAGKYQNKTRSTGCIACLAGTTPSLALLPNSACLSS